MLYVVIIIAAIAFFAGVHFGQIRMEAKANQAIDGFKLITNALIEDMGCCIADAIKLQDENEELIDKLNGMEAVFADMMESYESTPLINRNN